MEEKEYREIVAKVFKKIENGFDSVDPDLAECVFSQGALVITFADRSKLILSQQPSVRQVWLAAAAKGIAYHFNFNPSAQTWNDDKGLGIELMSFVAKTVSEAANIKMNF